MLASVHIAADAAYLAACRERRLILSALLFHNNLNYYAAAGLVFGPVQRVFTVLAFQVGCALKA
jgi:hypothetical protein